MSHPSMPCRAGRATEICLDIHHTPLQRTLSKNFLIIFVAFRSQNSMIVLFAMKPATKYRYSPHLLRRKKYIPDAVLAVASQRLPVTRDSYGYQVFLPDLLSRCLAAVSSIERARVERDILHRVDGKLDTRDAIVLRGIRDSVSVIASTIEMLCKTMPAQPSPAVDLREPDFDALEHVADTLSTTPQPVTPKAPNPSDAIDNA